MAKNIIQLKVNGDSYQVLVKPNMTLLEILREELNFTGTKKGCNEGECGACTVILEGKPVCSCLVLALEAEGKEVVTIEGLANGDELHPLQKAFIDNGAIQCGFCTPGMILSAKALLDNNPRPTDIEIKEAIAGNICRCGGYNVIVNAIKTVTKQ
jgi:carbon-monoxide dehydrogenase small subunit